MFLPIVVLFAFVVVFTIPSANAEEGLIIEGFDGDNDIFISVDGNENMIVLDTIEENYIAFDSKIKYYHTGGFSLKNVEVNIALWVHPFSDTEYRIVILTNDGIYRIIGTELLL